MVVCLALLVLTGCGTLIEQESAQTESSHAINLSAADITQSAPTTIPLLDLAEHTHTPNDAESTRLIEVEPVSLSAIERIASELTWEHHLDQPRVQQWLTYYQANPHALERLLAQVEPLLFTVYDLLREKGLPPELSFLPMVESAYIPEAKSHAGAAGLWQFMPPTANAFELEIDSWQDQRLNAYQSTLAAADYLSYLHDAFDGDWLLALAAYNSGQGNVRRKVSNSGESNYWDLNFNAETASYIPQLFAILAVVKNPQDYGITLPAFQQQHLELVRVPQAIDVELVKEFSGMEEDAFYFLNPHYTRGTTPPNREAQFLLPPENVLALSQTLENTPTSEWLKWTIYEVSAGDTLGKIALDNGLSWEYLAQFNHLKGTTIYLGQELKIPTSQQSQIPRNGSQIRTIVVSEGDTLWDIARRERVELTRILELNELNNSSVIFPGDHLKI